MNRLPRPLKLNGRAESQPPTRTNTPAPVNSPPDAPLPSPPAIDGNLSTLR